MHVTLYSMPVPLIVTGVVHDWLGALVVLAGSAAATPPVDSMPTIMTSAPMMSIRRPIMCLCATSFSLIKT